MPWLRRKSGGRRLHQHLFELKNAEISHFLSHVDMRQNCLPVPQEHPALPLAVAA